MWLYLLYRRDCGTIVLHRLDISPQNPKNVGGLRDSDRFSAGFGAQRRGAGPAFGFKGGRVQYTTYGGQDNMLSFQRREEIKQILLKQKSITVTAVAAHFGVSDETIRRDLTVLSNEGFCNKTYGGASLATRSTSHIPQRMKKELFVDEKRFMAKIAASVIRPKDCVFLDHSTTVSELCREIKSMPLTVVTNSLWVISELSDLENIDLVVTGGHCRTMDRGMFGQETLNFLNHHYFDKAFFSCRGLNIGNGIFDASEHTASFHQTLIDRAAETFLMADHTKFGVSGFINITSYAELDNFITDAKLDELWREVFETNGVRVLNTLPANDAGV